MHKTIRLFAGLTALLAMGSAQAQVACPAPPIAADTNPDTGHYFEVYAAPGITWAAAKVCANKANATHPEVSGHLATITSSKEDAWVDNLRKDAGLREVWVGGSQAAGSTEPGNGWLWKTTKGLLQRRNSLVLPTPTG